MLGFSVDSSPAAGASGAASFGFFAYPAGESAAYVGAATSNKPGPGSSTIHKGKGTFYLKVLGANAKWSVTVIANYVGSANASVTPPMTQVAQYHGTGDQETPTFHITGSRWRVHLHTGAPTESGAAGFFAYPAGETASYVGQADISGREGGDDVVSYIEQGKGDYYLKIVSANTDWTATVEQASS